MTVDHSGDRRSNRRAGRGPSRRRDAVLPTMRRPAHQMGVWPAPHDPLPRHGDGDAATTAGALLGLRIHPHRGADGISGPPCRHHRSDRASTAAQGQRPGLPAHRGLPAPIGVDRAALAAPRHTQAPEMDVPAWRPAADRGST